ncbi:hypothetical protein [Hymenobacter tenuis]
MLTVLSVVWRAFVLTWLIEWLLFLLFERRGLARTAGFIFLINLFTWPLCQLLYWHFPAYLPAIELGVVAAEAGLMAYYFRWTWVRAGLVATALNTLSYFAGLALLRLPLFS